MYNWHFVLKKYLFKIIIYVKNYENTFYNIVRAKLKI